MSNSRDEWISNRAYALWEQAGREHGRDSDHWQQASEEWAELERSALPGHIHEPARDEGIPPEYLQADTQEEPAPKLAGAPETTPDAALPLTAKQPKAKEGNARRRPSGRNSVYEEKDYQSL